MPKNLVLVAGTTTQGKTASLRNLRDKEGVFYLCCESGKELPFEGKFLTPNEGLADPINALEYFSIAEENPKIHTIVLDSIDFLMEMYESQHVLTAKDTRAEWANYQQFFKTIMQEVVQRSKKNWIIIGHQAVEQINELEYRYYVPIKGAVAKTGVGAYFNVIVYARKVKLKEIEKTKVIPELLHITEKDKALGFKHVFQVEVTKEYVNSEIRGPMGLWEDGVVFIDNDVQILLDYLDKYYGRA